MEDRIKALGMFLIAFGLIFFGFGHWSMTQYEDMAGQTNIDLSDSPPQAYQTHELTRTWGAISAFVGFLFLIAGVSSGFSYTSQTSETNQSLQDSSQEESGKLFCTSCGTRISDEDSYCSGCGEEL